MAKLDDNVIRVAENMLESFLQDNILPYHDSAYDDQPDRAPTTDSELIDEWWEFEAEMTAVLQKHMKRWGGENND